MASTDHDKQHRDDLFFLGMARYVAGASKCVSRQVGAVLTFDGAVRSTGRNGSPRGSSICNDRSKPCRRRVMGFKSGEGTEHCVAIHAEANAIIQAGRQGTSTDGCTLYCWCGRPCVKCMGVIINAGISRLVYLEVETEYDELSEELLAESGIEWCRINPEDV